MDYGTYNCRDYYVTTVPVLHATITKTSTQPHDRPPLHRHESWAELEHRSRSPASFQPKFPLLKLPLELRLEIFSYLLPRTKELGADSNPLTAHARSFSAVQKRREKGMLVPATASPSAAARQDRTGGTTTNNIVWLRGQMSILSVCRQLHTECTELVYSRNTFLLFLTYSRIDWRYRFLLPTGMAPTKTFPFLEVVPERYRRLVKRVVVNVDHVDAYTGMTKFNVGGKGLVWGLRRQVQRLVLTLGAGDEEGLGPDEKPRLLNSLSIRISNSNAIVDALDRRNRNGAEVKVAEDLDIMLEPFRQLYGVRHACVSGAITAASARDLEVAMKSAVPTVSATLDSDLAGGLGALKPVTGLCVYGNDVE
ncbi:hypothetical protein LTR62_001864 [Meristemomyces frigidus]|uniref:F-box domain-containing protein n=1 Tax=Meristemomyces frigidus TaxID=1508187 RepID=A0AAN7T904_9PEZI|nr:hypothetical protein LTR62_001864 [Meristemomyces frigidus]